jgi:hypothetical protein
MAEGRSIPVPYVTAILGSLLALLTAGVIWLVGTTNEVPRLKDKMAEIERRLDAHEASSLRRAADIEQRLRVCEGRIFPIPNGPYRGDRQ